MVNKISGTQSIGRAATLLRMLATRGEIGWRLCDLAAACGLDKGTAHRILCALMEERLVKQRAADKRYLAGPMLYELSLSLPRSHAFNAAIETQCAEWARRMNGKAVLQLRSGGDYVCSVLAGPSKLSSGMDNRGTRRPLFTSAGGVAILLALPAAERQRVIEENVEQEIAARGPGRLHLLEKMRERSELHGFGVNLGDVVPGIHAFAVALHDTERRPFAALCIMGAAQHFPDVRLDEVHQELRRVAHGIEIKAAEMLFSPGAIEA